MFILVQTVQNVLLKGINKRTSALIMIMPLVLLVACTPSEETTTEKEQEHLLTVHANQTLVNKQRMLANEQAKITSAKDVNLLSDAKAHQALIEKQLLENAAYKAEQIELQLIESGKRQKQLVHSELIK
jgi:hypothetical protein